MTDTSIALNEQISSVALDQATLAKRSKRSYMAAMIGNALEYYDNSLYGVMAPLLVAVFLPALDSVDAYILAYVVYPSSVVPALLGAWLMGWIGDHFGRKKALTTTIWGMAIVTGLIGFMPTYGTIGVAAPFLFIFFRMLQKFFSAGEYNGGAIFTQEHAHEKRKGLVSGFYCSFTVVGIITASIVGTGLAYLPYSYWRVAYIVGFFTAIGGVYLRKSAWETPEFVDSREKQRARPPVNVRKIIPSLLVVMAASGFFGAVYCLPTMFLTTFLPLVTSFRLPDVMLINTLALVVYMFALPCAGWMADKYGFKRVMLTGAIATACCTMPLLALIAFDTIWSIVVLKFGFALLSAWFIGPFHAWSQQLFAVQQRYRCISIAYNLGAKIGGGSTPALAFWLWKMTGQLYAPAFVMIGWAVLGGVGVWMSSRRVLD